MIENITEKIEKALIIGILLPSRDKWRVEETLSELFQLTLSAGAEVYDQLIIKQHKIKAGHYIGIGKAEEISQNIRENNISLVIFDDDLSPLQGRNLERIFKIRVIDRSQLILDIFSLRAKTKEGTLQVRLAQHQYLLPRLRRMWTHLERQKGGIGLRGPGETQLEMDRRSIQILIKSLKRDLELVKTRRKEQRRNRKKTGWTLISLIGYTNAGKSTLLNKISGSKIYSKDQLFATLDPTTRKIDSLKKESVLITDTVGFIQKLPTHLVKSFRATLEEVIEADILIHVIDSSHDEVDNQVAAVNQILNDIGVIEKTIINVLNKSDINKKKANLLKQRYPNSVVISAKNGDGLNDLLFKIEQLLENKKNEVVLHIPLTEGKIISMIKKNGILISEKYDDKFVKINARVSPSLKNFCKEFIKN